MNTLLAATAAVIVIIAMSTGHARAYCSTIIDHSGEDIKLLDKEMRESTSAIASQVALAELICTKNPAHASAATRWALSSDNVDIQNIGMQGKFVRASTLSFSVLTIEEIDSGQFDVVPSRNLSAEAQNAVTAGLAVSIPLYGNPNENLCFSTYQSYKDCRASTTVSYGNRAVTITTDSVKGTVHLAEDGTFIGMLNVRDNNQGGKTVFIPVRVKLN